MTNPQKLIDDAIVRSEEFDSNLLPKNEAPKDTDNYFVEAYYEDVLDAIEKCSRCNKEFPSVELTEFEVYNEKKVICDDCKGDL